MAAAWLAAMHAVVPIHHLSATAGRCGGWTHCGARRHAFLLLVPQGWSLRQLDTLLDRVLRAAGHSLPGVSEPYLYFGMWRSTFAWWVQKWAGCRLRASGPGFGMRGAAPSRDAAAPKPVVLLFAA